MGPAELVDTYIRLRGDLAAFEAEAHLPKGLLTGALKEPAANAQPKAGGAPHGSHANGPTETPDSKHAVTLQS